MTPGTLVPADGLREALGQPGAPAILERCRRVLELDRPGRDAAEVGRDVVAIALSLADAEGGALWLRRHREPTLQLLAALPERASPLAATVSAHAVERRLGTLPLACPPGALAPMRTLLQVPWETGILVPVEAGGRSGLLGMGRGPGAAPFTPELMETVRGFARLAAIPLAGALLRGELQQRDGQLRALRRVAAAVAEGVSVDELFRVTRRELGGLLAFDVAALVIADRRRDTGRVLVAERGKPPRRLAWSPDWTTTLGTDVLRPRRPVVVTDVSREAPALPFARDYPSVRTLLSASLVLDAGTVGALFLGSQTPDRFHDHDAPLVESIAGLLSIGIRHARWLVASVRRRTDAVPPEQPGGTAAEGEIGRLAGALAHRIRNPLTVIGTTLQHLRTHRLLTADDARMLEAADAKVREIDEALEALLSLSRPLALHQEPTVVAGLLGEIAEFIRARAGAHAVDVQVDAEAGTPQALIDRRYLGQALLTLALGALETMRSGGRLILAARAAADLEHVVLSIDTEDALAGHEPAALLDLSEGVEAHGTGLALAMTRRLVEAHGGALEARRDPAGGATFTLSLPAVA
jgi:signal transduction histidine kinase